MPELQASTLRWAKRYGETNKQMVARWAVQTCKELVKETYATGEKKGNAKSARVSQEDAIIQDAYNVVIVAAELDSQPPAVITDNYEVFLNTGKSFFAPPERILKSPSDVINWIEIHRTRRNRRTVKLPYYEKKICSRDVFDEAVKIKSYHAGMAKGAWIGAAELIERMQKGQKKLTVGKNFFSYAKKHKHKGGGKRPKGVMKPFALISNRVPWVASNHVLPKGRIKTAIKFGLSKTRNYYRFAVRAMERKRT